MSQCYDPCDFEGKDFACFVLIFGVGDDHRARGRIPLVRSRLYRHPLWKFPGGKKEGNETPEEVAAREIKQELGLVINRQKLEFITAKHNFEGTDREHWVIFFGYRIESYEGLQGDTHEDEDVRLFGVPDMIREVVDGNFVLQHKEPLYAYGLL